MQPCNDRLYISTSNKTGETASVVKETMDAVFSFTAGIIKEGGLQSVMLPYFGTFEPNVKLIQRNAWRKLNPKPNDSTGTESGHLRGATEQTLDNDDTGVSSSGEEG